MRSARRSQNLGNESGASVSEPVEAIAPDALMMPLAA